MSGVTKGELAAQNAELLEAMKKLETMNLETIALAKRARNDTDDVGRKARHYKQQRDRLIGFLQGYRRDIEAPIVDRGPATYQPEPIEISRVDAFLGECLEEPEMTNTAERSRF